MVVRLRRNSDEIPLLYGRVSACVEIEGVEDGKDVEDGGSHGRVRLLPNRKRYSASLDTCGSAGASPSRPHFCRCFVTHCSTAGYNK